MESSTHSDAASNWTMANIQSTEINIDGTPSIYVKLYEGFCLILGIIGICGNSLVLAVAHQDFKKKKKGLNNLFLINLTTVDFLASVLIVLTFGMKMVFPEVKNDVYCWMVTGKRTGLGHRDDITSSSGHVHPGTLHNDCISNLSQKENI